jgi:hypothetical protein
MKADFGSRWQALSEDVQNEMRAWRLQHPRATFSEMETTLDEQLDRLRACMLEDMALASDVADLCSMPPRERPPCPHCNAPLGPRGKDKRCLRTEGDQLITLERSYAVCPTCGVGFFPSG